jgi:hypothetical protein
MDSKTKLRYQGCISTPPLWVSDAVSPFQQIDLAKIPAPVNKAIAFKSHRLGKLVEEFVFHQLKSQNSVSWISDSLQIQEGKRTIGEIDALYYNDGLPVHLEIAYKFYLYDTVEDYDDQLARWIGPNRKDSLFYKLSKLHSRQFPLLHTPLTKAYLENYELEAKDIRQRLCFKAQLFLPYQNQNVDIAPLNPDCVAGFYISYRELHLFSAFGFFIPAKLDWLLTPQLAVNWIGFDAALKAIRPMVDAGRSPLVWVRNGANIFKAFVVFWD